MQHVNEALNSANVDIGAAPFTREDVLKGMRVEYEHGTWGTSDGLPAGIDVIGRDKTAAAKIALAHLLETRDGAPQYDYYDGLEVIEGSPAGIWRGRAPTYWRNARIAFIIVLVIVLIALMSSSSAGAKVVVVLLAAALIYMKADIRGYLL